MEISAKMVKELRESTGAGMMDCKKALVEAAGDLETATDILRTKGLAALAKKAGRATNEGLIGGFVNDDTTVAVLVEVNCETDFVARNADFKAFVDSVASHIATAAPADVDALMNSPFADRPDNFEQVLGEQVAKIGENMGVARFTRYEIDPGTGTVAVYIHGVGNIAVIVEFKTDGASSDGVAQVARDVAMQVAAAMPIAVDRDSVDSAVVEHETAIYRAQAAESGKPEPIQEKIAQGRLEKYFKEVALLEQPFVKDPDISVADYIAKAGKANGVSIVPVRFERMVLGETAASAE